MPTVLLDAVFKPFFKIVHNTGQQLTIDWTNFLTDGFLQIIQSTGFVSVNWDFKYPQRKKITHWKFGRTRGPWHVSETGNEVPGKHVSNNDHWFVCSVRCGTILLKPHISTVYSSSAQSLLPPTFPRPNYWVLPIQKMSVSLVSPRIIDNIYRSSWKSNFNFLDRFSKNPQISRLMKIRPVGAELFQAKRRTRRS